MLYHDPQALIAQPKASDHISLEWIADSGAGRDTASIRAFSDQGIQNSIIQSSTQATSPVKFETGNGSYTSDTCVELNGESFGQASFSVMNDCPVVRSLGKIVSSGRPFIWIPGEMPFFANSSEHVQIAADEPQVVYASRVEEHVPIFCETFKGSDTFALPADELPPRDAEEAPAAERPPEVGDVASDADSENADEEPLSRAQRLQAEAQPTKHQMCHMPKNPYCDICRRSRMYRRKVTRKRAEPLESRGELDKVTNT